MATPPPLSPTVATPLAHRKRRHSEMNGSQTSPGSRIRHSGCDVPTLPHVPAQAKVEDSNGLSDKKDDIPDTSAPKQEPIKQELEKEADDRLANERRLDDDDDLDDDSDIDRSEFEDIIDTAELEPFSFGAIMSPDLHLLPANTIYSTGRRSRYA